MRRPNWLHRSAGALLLAASCTVLCAQVKLPPYTREVLPNGVVVYLAPKTGVPLVNFRVLVRGGEESEPPQLAGLAAITAELLRRGSGDRSASTIAEEIDGLGGVLGAFPDRQATGITGEFLKKDFDRGLAIVADTVLRPSFPQSEVSKTIARHIDGIKSLRDNPFAINSYFRRSFFGADHPYGHVSDEASLDRIRRQDILDYHKRMYVGRNLVVIVTGDFDPEAAKKRVADAFASAPAGAAYQWVDDRPPARPAAPSVLLIDKPDATQTYFIIAQPGARRGSPDRVPLLLMNTLFGGRFTSLINDALRVTSGLTYGASSVLESNRLTGALYITTYTRTDSTAQAIDMALDVLKRAGEKGITAEQLASAKAYVKGTYPPSHLQTADQIATALGDMELFGLGRDDVDEFFARIDAVTLERANAVLKQYYRADNLSFVLLGNASKIREVAAKYGKVTERNIREPGW